MVVDWVERIRTKHGSEYEYLDVPKTAHQIIRIVCKLHGVFPQRVREHANGAACPRCSIRKRNEVRWGKGVRVRDKITLECDIHGPYEKTEIQRRTNRGKCPKCSFLKRGLDQRVTYDQFQKRASQVQPVGTLWEERNFSGVHDRVKTTCPMGHVWNPLVHDHLRGIGCPICAKKQSRGEREVLEFLRSLGLRTEERNRKLIGKEIDILLPDHFLGIEYDGLFWHCENPRFPLTKSRFHLLDKTKKAHDAGVRLIHIYEDEWRDKRTAVQTALKLMTGVASRYQARHLTLRTIEKQSCDEFLEIHHVGGKSAGSTRYGAYLGKELVGVAVYGRPSRQTISTPWELKRYCVNGVVPGLLSRFMKRFSSECEGRVVTYLDRRWFSGTTYTKNGFVHDGEVRPDYYYVDLDTLKRYHKSRFRRKDDISERERTALLGKIWDCGKARYIWTPTM